MLTRRSRWFRPGVLFVVVFWAVALIGSVQLERGVGSLATSLTFIAFDLLLIAALTAALMVLTARPFTSMFGAGSLVGLVWFASHLKQKYTQLAAQADDIALLMTTWNVAKGYAWPALIAIGVCLVAIGVVLVLERPRVSGAHRRAMLAGLAALLLTGCMQLAERLPLDDAEFISGQRGPKVALFFRSIYEPARFNDIQVPELGGYCCFRDQAEPRLDFEGRVKPNIVIVLQESTFPPSNLKGVPEHRGFLMDRSAPLSVHVAGSGTWVEEYSVLHGVPPSAYGRDYVQIVRLGLTNGLTGRIAPMLERAGYETASFYPVEGDAANGENIQRALGMKDFADCRRIPGCDVKDWDTPDSLMFGSVLSRLQARPDRPQFVFTATIRQHSPHVLRFPLSAHREEIVAEYQRRLALSDQDARDFVGRLRSLKRPTIVLMFGDHVPADVFGAFSASDFRTDLHRTFFNVFDSRGQPVGADIMARYPGIEAVDSAFLDALLLRQAGFDGDYVRRKLAYMVDCGGRFCRTQTAAR